MIYRHFKGGMYKIICEGKNSETLEEVIVYQSLKDESIWVRPKKMFFEIVNGVPRFKKIE